MCMDYVPSNIDFTGGENWSKAILHILTPRIFFPDKEILDDSQIARKYTGFDWSGAERGTSISIGYIAESYVDFGPVLFFLPILFLGWLLGTIYKYFLSVKGESIILNVGAIIPILISFQLIERSGNKLIGGIIMSTLVYIFIIQRFVYPILLRYLLKR